ncbi:MAG: DUF4976 domain-containing protein [bacterium]|nr:DUF4976 domain-containing protein [bacterium]
MPTLLDYAGLAIPDAVQGRSLRPLIEGRPGPWAERYVFSETASNPKDVQRMIRDKRWKYVFRSNKRLDLYDLATDPEENINLFDDPATAKPEHIAKARELHAALHRWMVESEDPYAQYVPEQLNLETKTNQSARKRRPAAMAG